MSRFDGDFELIDALTEGLNEPRKDKKVFEKKIRYPLYDAIQHLNGYLVKMTEQGGKNNPAGKFSYCNGEKFFLKSKKPFIKLLTKERAKGIIDELVREDYLQKKAFNFKGSNPHDEK